jgi:enoyl-CoA hydratase
VAETATSGTVRTENDGRLFSIVVDNVAKKNAFTPAMMAELSDAFTRFDRDESSWVAVLSFAGKDTTAGLDMPKFFGPSREPRDSPAGNIDPFALKRRTLKLGIELMLAADIVVAADDTRFCQMESRRGIAPLGGAHFRFLTRTGWGNAMYHLMLCDEFGAERALQIGLVQEVVPAGQQVERAVALAHRIAGNAPLGLRAMKQAALRYIEAGEAMAIAAIPTIHDRVMGTEDAREGIRSFVERRAARFEGR